MFGDSKILNDYNEIKSKQPLDHRMVFLGVGAVYFLFILTFGLSGRRY
jgi:hypothetical protein